MRKNSIRLKQCKECEQLFYAPRGRTTIYCSEKCCKEARANRQRIRRKNGKIHRCKVCYREFEANTHNKKYCSTKCAVTGARQMNLAKKERYKKIAPHLANNHNGIHITNLTDWSHRKELEIEKQIKVMQNNLDRQ